MPEQHTRLRQGGRWCCGFAKVSGEQRPLFSAYLSARRLVEELGRRHLVG